jgi:hypothetical protein
MYCLISKESVYFWLNVNYQFEAGVPEFDVVDTRDKEFGSPCRHLPGLAGEDLKLMS